MAQLSGLSSEAFSPPTGLGSILRDHKMLPGVRTTRANMAFGVARAPVAQSVSVSSSPKDSFLLDVGTADEVDDLNEEDIWGMDDTADDTRSGTDFEKRRMSSKVELGLGMSPKQRVKNTLTELGFSSSKTEKLMPVKRKENLYGATDVFNGGSKGPSFFSRNFENNSVSSRTRIPRRPSASRMIPMSGGGDKGPSGRHAEGQSAPVEVPRWSKTMAGHSDKVGIADYVGKGSKDEDDDPLPPHELLARENARSQSTTFSVCEGLGRTLKGRDLSRVRNAVWSQMGFAD